MCREGRSGQELGKGSCEGVKTKGERKVAEFANVSKYMKSRQMVLKKLFAGQ